jgi:hypothetical protein
MFTDSKIDISRSAPLLFNILLSVNFFFSMFNVTKSLKVYETQICIDRLKDNDDNTVQLTNPVPSDSRRLDWC